MDPAGGGPVTDLDRLTSLGAEELTRRLRDHGDADPEFVSREFMLWLRGQGWRPTEARIFPAWPRSAGSRSEPPEGLLRDLRADLDAKATAFRESQHDDDPDAAA
jgi:hypothetical protein